MKYFAYVLKSNSHNRFYTGSTNNIKRRLAEHNSGKTKSIKAFIPWEIIYFEEFDSAQEARAREKYFKSGTGREFLKSFLSK